MSIQSQLLNPPRRWKVSLRKIFGTALTLVAPLSYAATTSVDCSVTDLHTAITNAAAGDTISIKNTCYANGATFIINKNLTLVGADATAILDGTNGGLSSANPVPVVWVQSPDAKVTLQGLTIQNGIADRTVDDIFLAGGLTNNGDTTVIQSSVINNSGGTIGAAGGISSDRANNLTIQQSLIAFNHTPGHGGGIRYDGSQQPNNLYIAQSTIYGNTAGSSGGGLYFYGSASTQVQILQSTISGNSNGIAASWPKGEEQPMMIFISQSIVANSTEEADIFNKWGLIINDFSLIGPSGGPSLNVNLGQLDHYGGPTKTLKPLPASGTAVSAINFVPVTSVMVNNVATSSCNGSVTPDQRGAPKPGIGKPGVGMNGCDAGAYETGAPKLSLIMPSNGTLSFGPVTQGNSLTLLSQVQNTGNDALLISDAFTVAVAPSVVSKFALVTPPAIPVNLPVQQVQNLNVQYTPTAGTTDTATLHIRNTDTSNNLLTPVVVDLTGSGSGYVLPPIQQITDILNFVKSNHPTNLNGVGKGVLAKVSFKLFVVGIKVSGTLIGAGKTQLACVALKDLALLTDGKSKPPDIITGNAAPQLYAMIKTLTTTLGCAP